MDKVQLLRRYPFLRDSDPDSYLAAEDTWADNLPTGWRQGFIGVCESISLALADFNIDSKYFSFAQVKEKYGYARLHWDLRIECDEDVRDILDKRIEAVVSVFENETRKMCADCGKKATFASKVYILPYCRCCADAWLERYRVVYKNKHAKFKDCFRREV